jgi:hypothetical protein
MKKGKKYEPMHIPETIEPHVWMAITVIGVLGLVSMLWLSYLLP